MKIAFNSPTRKRLTAAVVLVFVLAYMGLATREFAASWLGSRTDLNSLERAAWLDSGNAEYRNHVGRYYDLVARDPLTAIGHFKAAVQLNPHSADYWFDLASAYQVLGNTANQTVALERAIQADPMKPDVAWTAANFYLVQGDKEKALHEFRVVMANDTSLAASAIAFCWRITPDVDVLLRDAVPPTANAYVAFLALLQNDVTLQFRKVVAPTDDTDVASLALQIKNETAGTFKIWDALLQTHQPFEARYANDYIQFLIQHKEVDQAVLAWQETATLFERTSYLPSPGNLVVNGNFSLRVLNAGFDWQIQKQTVVRVTLDPAEPYGGQPSLSISFDGPRISDAGIFQYIPVQPSTTYEFSAHYKTKGDVEGAGGPHFTVQDMYSQAVYYESDELRDAVSWKPTDGEHPRSRPRSRSPNWRNASKVMTTPSAPSSKPFANS